MKGRLWGSTALAVLLGAIANAGLFASTSSYLRPLTALSVSSALLIPGVVVIAALVALVVGDAGRSAIAIVMVAVLGATLYGLAIAAPGLRVEGARVKLINDGTTFGLVALLISGLFGMAGLMVVWVARALLGRPESF